MGAEFVCVTMDGSLGRDQVQERFQKLQADGAHASGHEYSGTWNMLDGLVFETDRDSFASEQAAETFVAENAEKWAPGLAVRYRARMAMSQPTFHGQATATGTVRQRVDGKVVAIVDWQTKEIVPADQLGERDKAAVVTAAARYRAAEGVARAARKALGATVQAITRLENVPASVVTGQQAKVREANAALLTATTALDDLCDCLIPHLYATADAGERWLIGGWAAS